MKKKVSNKRHLKLKTGKEAENNFQQYPIYPVSNDICSKYHEDEMDEFYSLEAEIRKFRNRIEGNKKRISVMGIN